MYCLLLNCSSESVCSFPFNISLDFFISIFHIFLFSSEVCSILFELNCLVRCLIAIPTGFNQSLFVNIHSKLFLYFTHQHFYIFIQNLFDKTHISISDEFFELAYAYSSHQQSSSLYYFFFKYVEGRFCGKRIRQLISKLDSF